MEKDLPKGELGQNPKYPWRHPKTDPKKVPFRQKIKFKFSLTQNYS